MSADATTSKPDLRALTGLRGIAAWFVVFYHIRTGMSAYLPDGVMGVLAKGYLAVDFFFLLSGFVIWLSYSERFRAAGYSYSIAFYWRRIARIWPLHLFIIFLVIAFVAVLFVTGKDSSGYPMAELPLHIFLLQNWGFTSELSWNHPAWSISTEMAAYLIFPILAVGVRWDRFPSAVLIGLVGIMTAIVHLYFALRGYVTLGDQISQTGLFRCMMQFTIGTILCVLWQRWRMDWTKAGISGALGTIILVIFIVSQSYETILIPISFACLVLAAAISAEMPGNPLGRGALHYLGEISYATYLIHFMLFIWFKIVFVSDPMNVSAPMIGLFLVLTFVASAILYRWIEKPGQRIFLHLEWGKTKILATK